MEYQCNQWSMEEQEGGFGAFSARNSAKNSAKYSAGANHLAKGFLACLAQPLLETWSWIERFEG
jgi:hypothetical protein